MVFPVRWVGVAAIITLPLLNYVSSDVVNNVNIDPKCSTGGTLHVFRFTDCNTFPCLVKRGKEYTVDADFSLSKDIIKPTVKCGTIYLGRQVKLSGYGGCETITNGSCPTQAEVVYNSKTSFTVPYYVPPMLYTVWCRMEDDNGQSLVCGSGSGKVV